MPRGRSPETRSEIPAEEVPGLIAFLESPGEIKVEDYSSQDGIGKLTLSRKFKDDIGRFALATDQFNDSQVQEGFDWFKTKCQQLGGTAPASEAVGRWLRLLFISVPIGEIKAVWEKPQTI